VIVHGDFLPRSLFRSFSIVFAILRSLFLAFCILFSKEKFDVIFCDQISASIPILRLTGSKVLFFINLNDILKNIFFFL